MKIGIISDIHNHRQSLRRAVEIFNEQEVRYILCAGDISSASVAGEFAGAGGAKLIAVFGNCDSDRFSLAAVINGFGGEIHEAPYTTEVDGKRVFITHKLYDLESMVNTGEYDLVIYGHTHKRDIRKVGETLVVNPGTLSHWLKGKSAVVVLELYDMSYKTIGLKSL